MELIFNYLILLIKTILSVLKIIVKSKYFSSKGERKHDKCIVLGNGPSVIEDLNYLNDRQVDADLLCLNKFPDTEYYEVLKPMHFVIVSTEFWEKGALPEYNKVRDDIIDAVISKTTWPLNVFLPANARHHNWFLDKLKANANLKVIFYNTTPIEGIKSINHFLLNLKLGSPRPHNVLIPSILNAIWMGYKEIGIVGADHSWLETLKVNDQNEALLNQKHFYDPDKKESVKMTKHGSNYRKLHEILEKFMLTFKAYFVLNDFAISKDVQLYNCSRKSYIDGLQRINLQEFVKK